jgi:hypothetical protein
MKKVLTILLAVIFPVVGMQITLDRHYCGGKLADVKISVTGKMASCGMEQSESNRPDHPTIDNKCCEDKVSFYSITSNYCPEHFKLAQPIFERDILPLYVGNLISGNTHNAILTDWVLPPGDNLTSRLTQPEICVFRV